MRLYRIMTLIAALLAACAPAIRSAPTIMRVEAATATLVPTNTPRPQTAESVAATATPDMPFPITWTVRGTTSSDGRVIYVVEDPAVIRAAQEGYERLRNYYTFPNGLPLKEQIEKDAAEFTVDPDRARGMVEKLEEWRSYGGYWIYTPFEKGWKWDDTAEFNADGSQVALAARTFTVLRAEWFDLQASKITHIQDSVGAGVVTVTMIYDPMSGKWKVLTENTVGEDGPVVTATPSP